MLTKPVEAGTVKCEVYWPEKVNETLNLKPTLQVRTTYMQYFADFDMRSFEVSNVSNNLCAVYYTVVSNTVANLYYIYTLVTATI